MTQGAKREVELRPDGWNRFESAVDAAVKSGPHHRQSKPNVQSNRAKPKSKRVSKRRA